MPAGNEKRVLVVGVYLLDAPNCAIEISRELAAAKNWRVDLRWTAVGSKLVPPELEQWTVSVQRDKVPKFQLINQMISEDDRGQVEFIIVTDDDIQLEANFLDRFLQRQQRYDLALAQPARTHDSYIDHYFVAQLMGVDARATRFVEIGPIFSLRKDSFSLLLPFDESAPMGWGLDFVWPVQLEAAGFRQGIVDAVPAKHALRAPVTHYNYESTRDAMNEFMSRNKHLPHLEAFVALESFPITGALEDDSADTQTGAQQ